MESSAAASKVEVIKEAIKQLMAEIDDEDDDVKDDDDRHRLLLAKLMSQLEEEEEGSRRRRLNEEEEEEEEEEEKVLKEMKKMRRQNIITQCLVSVMILLTVAWQISEVSLILKLKDGVTHPFRSVGNIFKSLLIKPPSTSTSTSTPHQDHDDNAAAAAAADTTSSLTTSNLIESTPVHDLKLPSLLIDLPKMDLLGFNLPQQD